MGTIGPMQAEILDISSPHCISVRLSTSKDLFCLLQQSLSTLYCSDEGLLFSLQPGEYPRPGQSYAVNMPAAWYRGLVIHPNQDMNSFMVRLVDVGRVVKVKASALFTLAPQFLRENAYSFLVHLSQLSEDSGTNREVVKYMEELVRDQEVVTLHRRAPPKLVDGQWSLPVEISWTEQEDVDPFLPSIKREVFMSQRLLSNNNSSVKTLSLDFEDFDIDEPSNEAMKLTKLKETSGSKNLSSSQSPNFLSTTTTIKRTTFKWANPELPTKRHFYARATFVDDSGQIYMHLHDKRLQYRSMRSDLNNHFNTSSPDCAMDSFIPHQEVIAQYVDNVWYRARFLGYVPDSEYEQAFVLFVDWGNTSTVSTNLLRSNIVGKDIPIFAFRAVLHNVLPNRLAWAPGTIDFMMEKVLYTKMGGMNKIKVKVESGLDRQPLLVSIELYSPLDPGDTRSEVFKPWINMAELLVQKKEARYVSQGEVNSLEQKRSRKPFDYGVGFTVMKRRKDDDDMLANGEKLAVVSTSQDQIPRLDLSGLHLKPGSVMACKLAAVDSWDRVFIHLLSGDRGESMDIYSCFTSLDRCMQDKCREMPPVITPREGLTVAVWRGRDGGGWCRAEIVTCEEAGYLVRVVDWGIQQWISDSTMFKQLPDECLGVPAQAVPLLLPMVALEEEDTVLALLTECLLSAEDMEMMVEVTSCEGELFGHLLDKENNMPMYKRLEKEKVLRLL